MHYVHTLLATLERRLIPVHRQIDHALRALQILAVTQFIASVLLHVCTLAAGTPTIVNASYALAAVTIPLCVIVAGAIEIAARIAHGPPPKHWEILLADNPGVSARARLKRHIHKVVGVKIKSFLPSRVRRFYLLSMVVFALTTIPWLYIHSTVTAPATDQSLSPSTERVSHKPQLDLHVAQWGPVVTSVSALSALAMLVAITYVYPSLSKTPAPSTDGAKKPANGK